MFSRLRIGTRGSQLALWQANYIAASLGGEHEIIVIKTTGDNYPDATLDATTGIGIFTKEIEYALLSNQIDVAVHSFKDLPLIQPAGLKVAAIPPRGPVNDIIVTRHDCLAENQHWSLKQHAKIGTSSPRRRAQLYYKRLDLQLIDLRGNITSRINRVFNGELDAVVVAAAGINRLQLQNDIVNNSGLIISLPLNEFLPAPAQGALALEIRADDTNTKTRLEKLHDPITALAINSERALLACLGGGCQLPLGAYCNFANANLHLHAALANTECTRCYHAKASAATIKEVVELVYDSLSHVNA
ncbi:MAG: hydroxymethylbilane synthase [Deltaproteobacteria bacterium]|nr:hydroxymethylbilane synthase [Deltaproteobacteria bacterium]